MNISEKLKSLRKQRDLTQEEVAVYLSVSAQAISRWERGEAYPDITMLPGIASFYGVTTDELLCMEQLQDDKRKEEIEEEYKRLHNIGEMSAAVELMRSARKQYPSDFRIITNLAHLLLTNSDGVPDEDVYRANLRESIELSEIVVNDGKDQQQVQLALQTMAYAYDYLDEKEKAVEYAKKYVGTHDGFETVTLAQIETGEESVTFSKNQLRRMCGNSFYLFVANITQKDTSLTPEEEIKLYDKTIQMYDLLFEDGDYLFYSTYLAYTYSGKSYQYIKLGNHSAALDALEKAADLNICFDSLPPHVEHTSILARGLDGGNGNSVRNSAKTECRLMLERLEKEYFDPLRDDPRFTALIAKLEANA